PVLGRKGVEREVADAEAPARLDHGAHRFLADPVAVQASETAVLRPAAVAVHDDGHVPRQTRGIELHHHTAMISSSLALRTLSTRSTYSFVSASTFSAVWRRSSSVISL